MNQRLNGLYVSPEGGENYGAAYFSRHVTRILVCSDAGEARMTQSIVWRPFEKLDSRDDERIEPAACRHFRGGQALTPSPFTRIWQVDE